MAEIDEDHKEITFKEFERYRSENRETDFWVVDVRQESEYASGHVPGARLIPLGNLYDRLPEIPLDQDVFFYCKSGARSEVASIFTTESGRPGHKIYNITGGFLAYKGHSLEGFPHLQIFDYKDSTDKLLYQAMELEKGAECFYGHLLSSSPEKKFITIIEQLAKAETAHAKIIYNYWRETVKDPNSFEAVYGRLKGGILESGRPLSDEIGHIRSAGKNAWSNLIELALTIEIQAYDLYRNMADRSSDSTARDAFLSIAQMEKAHMKMVAGMLRDG